MVCLVLAFLAFAGRGSAQSWRVAVDGGYMMTNNSQFSQYNSPTYGLDASLLWRPEGNAYWQRFWKWPSFGLKGSYARIPNCPAGDRFGLVGLLVNPLGDGWEWQLGLGLSFYTKPYQLTGDTSNIFIGSLVNCLIDVGIGYHITDDILLSLRLLHTSNGMLMRPNQGLNYLQVDLGWKFGNEEVKMKNEELVNEVEYDEVAGRREWSVALSGGAVMARDSLMDGYYPCYDLSIYFQQYKSSVFAFGGAVDLWFNGSDWNHIRRDESAYRIPLYLSGMGVMEFFWGPLSLKTGLGLVVVSSNQVTIPFYERVGVYYNTGRNFMGVALNAHGGRIEFIEWTFGWRFF